MVRYCPFQKEEKENSLDNYGGGSSSSNVTTASVLVHYGAGDTCPSQSDVRARIRAHYTDDFNASHVELPVVKTYK